MTELSAERIAEIAAGCEGVPDDAWLIHKGGAFYRPDRAGYTTSKAAAGRYFESDARAEKEHVPEVTIGPASDWPDESFAIEPSELKSMCATILRQQAEIEGLRGALEFFRPDLIEALGWLALLPLRDKETTTERNVKVERVKTAIGFMDDALRRSTPSDMEKKIE